MREGGHDQATSHACMTATAGAVIVHVRMSVTTGPRRMMPAASTVGDVLHLILPGGPTIRESGKLIIEKKCQR